MMRIVFEGLSGAGKTSHTRRLAQEFRLPLLPGSMRPFLRELVDMPTVKPYYKISDELKDYIARQISTPIVLFDRCHVSTLAYAFALSKCKGAMRANGQCYEDQLEWYLDCIANERLSYPAIVFILDIPPEISVQRKPNAHTIDKNFSDLVFLDAIRDYYQLFYQIIEPQVSVYWINVQRPIEYIYSEIKEIFLQEIRHRNISLLEGIN